MEKTTTPHYRQYLEREFQTRLRKNPGYSLRAFARDLGMQPSKISEVLRGLKGLSVKSGKRIAKCLKLSDSESAVFLNLIELHQKRSRAAQIQAEENLRTLAALDGYGELSLDRFRIISDWYHFAILELAETEAFESNPSWIAGRLGISTVTASEAIDRLVDFGLLARDESGRLRQTQVNLATPNGIPSREVREHHSQILMKADAALEDAPLTERDFSTMTLAFDSKQMDQVRQEIREFRRRVGHLIQERPAKDRVYALAIQFFPIDKNEVEIKQMTSVTVPEKAERQK